jgi:hypothetical protein
LAGNIWDISGVSTYEANFNSTEGNTTMIEALVKCPRCMAALWTEPADRRSTRYAVPAHMLVRDVRCPSSGSLVAPFLHRDSGYLNAA